MAATLLLAACGGGGDESATRSTQQGRQGPDGAPAIQPTVLAVLPREFEHSSDHDEVRAILTSGGVPAGQGSCFKPRNDEGIIVGCVPVLIDPTRPIGTEPDSLCSPWLDSFEIPKANAQVAVALGFQIVDLGHGWQEVDCPSKSTEVILIPGA